MSTTPTFILVAFLCLALYVLRVLRKAMDDSRETRNPCMPWAFWSVAFILSLPLAASAVGEKLPGTSEQRRAYYLRAGFTNGCPVAVSKDGILLSNPRKIRLPVDNDIVSIKAARAEIAAFKASRMTSVGVTNLNIKTP